MVLITVTNKLMDVLENYKTLFNTNNVL
jgi:hypothetical protein